MTLLYYGASDGTVSITALHVQVQCRESFYVLRSFEEYCYPHTGLLGAHRIKLFVPLILAVFLNLTVVLCPLLQLLVVHYA